IKGKMEKAGFTIKFISHAIVLPFFPIALFRLIQRLLKRKNEKPKTSLIILPPFLNDILFKILKGEANLIGKGISFPFGVSIICRGVK
ncbi:MAG: hypothetical protein ACPL7E_06085, partial [bacterium]